ncbi:hypothetical protein C5Y81_06505 [Staphylococcus aureus]|nr:hypothetical protein C5Y45_06505 [Staphylococcus aureus]AWQ25514.1 hypothetical protein C5Y81_06505 [Staphylococcus aureus]
MKFLIPKITKLKRTCLHILMCTEPRKLHFGLSHLMLYEQVRFCYILAYLHANCVNANVLTI